MTSARRAFFVILLLLLAGVAQAVAAPKDHNRPVKPQAQSQPQAASPVFPGGGIIGLCQCIADRTARRFSCLSSPQECESSCASNHYSFVPHSPDCPATAGQRTTP